MKLIGSEEEIKAAVAYWLEHEKGIKVEPSALVPCYETCGEYLLTSTRALEVELPPRGLRPEERKGELHPLAKLSNADVIQLRADFAGGMRKVDLARKYGISRVHAGRVVSRECRAGG